MIIAWCLSARRTPARKCLAGELKLCCANPNCGDSCQKYSRKCREPNHLPLECEEIERDEEIEARRAIEERMTEALVR
jgi:hypothetical protein